MRIFHVAVTVSLALSLLAFTGLIAPMSARFIDSSIAAEEQWNAFKVQYNKAYPTAEEETFRFQVFKDNLVRAAELNMENPEATFGVTRFSDLSPVEFKRQYLGYRPEIGTAAELQRMSRTVQTVTDHSETKWSPNADVDWRTSGAVTAVKDQGQCGACWAFSAVEGVESAWFLKHKNVSVLSPQQVVSCDTGDFGCNGGDLRPAFHYLEKAGLTSEAAYPYTSGVSGDSGACVNPVPAPVANITGFKYATKPCFGPCDNQDESTLLNNLASTGPSSICVYAESWLSYTGGIMSSSSDCPHGYHQLDHCVQLVGYSGSGSTPYWIVRNSWGTAWGEAGYIYLKYGINICGVADEATFAIVA